MQELDQQVASARLGAEKFSNLFEGAVVERPTFGAAIATAPILNFHSLSQWAGSQTRLE